jgi:hypothetical protein
MWVDGQRHAPAALPPGKTRYPLCRRLVGSRSVWTGAENLAPTGIRSPNCPSRSQSLYRLRYPGPFGEHNTSINCTKSFYRYLYKNIALNVSTCFCPQGSIIRELNQSSTTQNQINHFCPQLTWCKRVKYLQCEHFLVKYLCKCAGS